MSAARIFIDQHWLETEVMPLFSSRVEKGITPGSIVALFDEEGIFHCSSHGDYQIGKGVPTLDTCFRIASCTKSFTAVAVLMLRDRGGLDLDDPITRYVPELPDALSTTATVAPTIRMLMCMNGGLTTDNPWADRQESITNDTLRALLRQGVQYSSIPGTRFEYSNLGYALLGQVVEAVSGRHYGDFVVEEILHPLSLNHTHFDYRDVAVDNMAMGYRRVGQTWEALPLSSPGAFSAIGGLISTVNDIVRWAQWLNSANHPEESDSDDILSAASRREMQGIHCPTFSSFSRPDTLFGYGFGLQVVQRLQLGHVAHHSGGYPGFSAHMRWSAESGIGIVAFENATYTGIVTTAREAFNQVLFAWHQHRQQQAVPAAPEWVEYLAEELKSLVTDWNESRLDAICAENVAMDIPYSEREQKWRELCNAAGHIALDAAVLMANETRQYESFQIEIPAAAGSIRISAEIGPVLPYKLQAVDIELVPLLMD